MWEELRDDAVGPPDTVLEQPWARSPARRVPASQASPPAGGIYREEPGVKVILEENPLGTGRSEENVPQEIEAQDVKV